MAFSRQDASLAAALAMMVVWGCNFALTKYILDQIGVGAFLFMRFAAMALLGFVLLAVVYRRNLSLALPRREDWRRFAACGLLGHTLHVGIVMWGINLSTAFSSSLVLTSAPLFTLLILAGLGGERLHARQIIGTGVAFAGIALFLSDKFTGGFALAGFGDLALLSASAMFSLYTVISKPLAERYGPVSLLAWTLAFGAPPMVALCAPAFIATPLAAQPPLFWLALAWVVVV